MIQNMDIELNPDFEELAIPQEHTMGCAVACVAFRCGLSYPSALALFSKQDHAWSRGFYCAEIVEALHRAGHLCAYAKYKESHHQELLSRSGTIIFVEPCEQYPHGHFFVRSSKGWMNPWANFPQILAVRAEFQEQLPGRITYVVF